MKNTAPKGKVKNLIYYVAGFLSAEIWGRFSGSAHFATSGFIAKLYNLRISRFFIKPYCYWQYGEWNYCQNFRPGNNSSNYRCFQDFFVREFRTPPTITSQSVWPCEGYLCEVGKVGELDLVKIKGEKRHLKTVFGESRDIPKDSYFSNVFLHNNNYHHIHAPTEGKISKIERIPGKLLLLRPWAYCKRPSLPALTNERVNVDIIDKKGKSWLLSIVGGPLVATIKLAKEIAVGENVMPGQKLATFELGSTCCMLSPVFPSKAVGEMVSMGESI